MCFCVASWSHKKWCPENLKIQFFRCQRQSVQTIWGQGEVGLWGQDRTRFSTAVWAPSYSKICVWCVLSVSAVFFFFFCLFVPWFGSFPRTWKSPRARSSRPSRSSVFDVTSESWLWKKAAKHHSRNVKQTVPDSWQFHCWISFVCFCAISFQFKWLHLSDDTPYTCHERIDDWRTVPCGSNCWLRKMQDHRIPFQRH